MRRGKIRIAETPLVLDKSEDKLEESLNQIISCAKKKKYLREWNNFM